MTPVDQKDRPAIGGRRRVPRRAFEVSLGVLLGGSYKVERSYQAGEGGMMISCAQEKLKSSPLTLLKASGARVATLLAHARQLLVLRRKTRLYLRFSDNKRSWSLSPDVGFKIL